MAFGGKLGIDATSKLPEEAEGRPSYPAPEGANIDVAALQAEFPELKAINTELLQAGISLVFVAIEKQRKGHVKQIARQLLAREAFAPVKVVIFMDPEVDLTQVQDTVWTFSNNTDVKRDSVVIEADEGNGYAHLALDGTRKTKALDDFPHVWPNILVMDDDTIASVDEKWPRLGLGEFLPSPSRKYKRQLYGDGPIAQAASEPVASEDHR
jgi:4-hydroxy-3-polyprenylbenzoate decarboxylase